MCKKVGQFRPSKIILQGKYDLIQKNASFYHVNVNKPVDAASSHDKLMQKVHLHLRQYHQPISNTIILQGKYDLIKKNASFYHVNVNKPVDAASSHTTLMQKVHLHQRQYHQPFSNTIILDGLNCPSKIAQCDIEAM